MAFNSVTARFWCHQCRKEVLVQTNALSGENACSICNGDFIEQIEETYNNSNEIEHPSLFSPPPHLPSQHSQTETNIPSAIASTSTEQNRTTSTIDRSVQATSSNVSREQVVPQRSGVYTTGATGDATQDLAVGISAIVQQMISAFAADPTNNFGIARDSPVAVYVHAAPSIRLAGLSSMLRSAGGTGSMGDYHVGSIEQLLNQLFHASGSRGTPPAAKHILEKLKKRKVKKEEIEKEEECAVCKEKFTEDSVDEEKSELIEFPGCGHLFCEGCILPWLNQHNTCPVCRHELETDDREYELMRKSRERNSNNNVDNINSTNASSSDSRE